MTNEDFYNLHIGQKIWFHSECFPISSLELIEDYTRIGIGEEKYSWNHICADCSLELPVKTVKDMLEEYDTISINGRMYKRIES